MHSGVDRQGKSRPRPAVDIPPRQRLVLWVARIWLLLTRRRMVRRFRRVHGYLPDPAWPRTYVEKVLWRKMFDRDPRFVTFTDKLATKAYIAERAPELPIPRTLWTGKDILRAPADLLAGPTVLKVNNGSGSNIVIDRGVPDLAELDQRTRRMLSPGQRDEEWAYWPIEPMLLIEELLPLGGDDLPTDIKVYIACGIPANVWAADKLGDRALTLNPSGNPVPERDADHLRDDQVLPGSPALSALVREAVGWARLLARDVDFLRVDFLVCDGRLLAGELTVYSNSGYERLANREHEAELGRAWDLRWSHFLQQPHKGITRFYADALIAAEASRLGRHQPDISDL